MFPMKYPLETCTARRKHKRRWKSFASISFENTFMLFLLPIFTYSYLFRLGYKLLSQYIPQGTCNTYRGVSTTDDTYHQRQCKITDAGHTPDVQRTYITSVVREVNKLRDSVWVMLWFTTSCRSSFLVITAIFSRTRSKITMVALIE